MSKKLEKLKILLSCPSDIIYEVGLIQEIIQDINRNWSDYLCLELELWHWSLNSYSDVGEDVQGILYKQIQSYDVFLGVVWSRYGSPTGRFGSGTEEEFMDAMNNYKRDNKSIKILFYFKEVDVPIEKIDPDQFRLLKDFKEKIESCKPAVLVHKFIDSKKFEIMLRFNLSRILQGYGIEWGKKSNIFNESKNEFTVKELDEDAEASFELGLNGISDLTNISKRMTELWWNYINVIETRTLQIQNINKNLNTSNSSLIKRVINLTAGDSNNFVIKMNSELDAFETIFFNSINYFLPIYSQPHFFNNVQVTLLNDNLTSSVDLLDTQRNILKSAAKFKETIIEQRDFTEDHKKSKENLKKLCNKIINTYNQNIHLLESLISNIEILITTYSKRVN